MSSDQCPGAAKAGDNTITVRCPRHIHDGQVPPASRSRQLPVHLNTGSSTSNAPCLDKICWPRFDFRSSAALQGFTPPDIPHSERILKRSEHLRPFRDCFMSFWMHTPSLNLKLFRFFESHFMIRLVLRCDLKRQKHMCGMYRSLVSLVTPVVLGSQQRTSSGICLL